MRPIQDALQRLHSSNPATPQAAEAIKRVSDAFFALVNLQKACSVTLGEETRAELGFSTGMSLSLSPSLPLFPSLPISFSVYSSVCLTPLSYYTPHAAPFLILL